MVDQEEEVVIWPPEATAGDIKATQVRWRQLRTERPPKQLPAWDAGSDVEPEDGEVDSPVTQRSRGGRLIFASRCASSSQALISFIHA